MSEKVILTKYNNSWYKPGNNFKCLLWYFTNVIFLKNGLNPSSKIKVLALKCFGAKIGRDVVIKPGVSIKYPWFLEIGNHVWIGENVWIDNLSTVKIADNVCVSQGAMLLCGNHNYKKESFDLIVESIVLEEGSWVGAKSIVGPGVILHSHAILAVNSVANKNLESYYIYQGNPAVKTRKRTIG